MGCHFLLQGVFPIQGSNPGLPHCGQTLYCLSHQGIPVIKRETETKFASMSKTIKRMDKIHETVVFRTLKSFRILQPLFSWSLPLLAAQRLGQRLEWLWSAGYQAPLHPHVSPSPCRPTPYVFPDPPRLIPAPELFQLSHSLPKLHWKGRSAPIPNCATPFCFPPGGLQSKVLQRVRHDRAHTGLHSTLLHVRLQPPSPAHQLSPASS